jgi:hypothetical protein
MSIASPSSSTMPELREVLERLGLTEYLQVLTENGFHNWDTVVDITEEDLTTLNFKLGHRRALQREIATYRGLPSSLSLDPETLSIEPTNLSTSALEILARQTSTPPPREKRRYRRHPRPDPNAPKKPKTACTMSALVSPCNIAKSRPDVNFADQLRTDPEVSQLSFVNIAREVGRRWQDLPAEQKRVWESSAARAMQEFEAQMDEYKKTESWRKYQLYLKEFRSQQAQQSQPSSVKRPYASRSTTDSSNNTRVLSRASPCSTDSPINAPLLSPAGIEAEACHNALTLAFSELVALRGEILNSGHQPYDEHHLPQEELVKRAMYAFIQGTGSLLFLWTYEQADEVLDRLYRPQKPVDAMTLAECFTVAAMGAHYDVECFPDRIRQILYASGTLHFHEQTARQDYMRTMRLMLFMSFYALLEKHLSARYLIGEWWGWKPGWRVGTNLFTAAGLQIARWKCPVSHVSGSGSDDENCIKIYRSLIFMDGWLSYTLGYSSEVTPTDVKARLASSHALSYTDIHSLLASHTSRR